MQKYEIIYIDDDVDDDYYNDDDHAMLAWYDALLCNNTGTPTPRTFRP